MGGSAGGLGGGLTKRVFGTGTADAAEAAAMEQQGAARKAFKEVYNIVNPATTAGLLQFDKDIARQEKNIARQEQLIAQIDPAIIEASQQALKLLRGEQSSTLAPIQAQRSQQRQNLLNTLRQQLGPGAETSTAGIQALTRFDSETNNLMAGQQQSALQGLGGLASQFTSMRPDMFREISGMSNFGQGKTALSFNQANTLFQARQPLLGTAGAQYTGDLLQAQRNDERTQAWADSSLRFGESMAGMGMGKAGGGGGGGGARSSGYAALGGQSTKGRSNVA